MLTRQQAAALRFMAQFVADHGYAPSYEQVGKGIGVASKSSVARLVAGLEERGFIGRRRHRARSIEILRLVEGQPLPRVPSVAIVVRAAAVERVEGGAVLVLHANDGPACYRLPDAVVETLRSGLGGQVAGLASSLESAGAAA